MRNENVNCAVVAPTHGDLRRVCFGGNSGLLSVIPRECFLKSSDQKGYSSSVAEIRLWNGSKITGFAAQEPDRLRGPQFHRAWCDEVASWRYPEAFDQLMFGLRLGKKPQCVITTTPKPTKLIKSLMEREDCYLTKGNTFENEANLAESALAMLKERYEGTTLGRQELFAEIIENVEGALWNPNMIEEARLMDEERDLTNDDLMICDDNTPMCIAGIYGGLNHSVSNDTTTIFLESAYFDPVTIRKSSKHHLLNTDSSYRFERGVDPLLNDYAIGRVLDIIRKYTKLNKHEYNYVCSKPIASHIKRSIIMDMCEFERLLGEKIPKKFIVATLSFLGFSPVVTKNRLKVSIPSHRFDISIASDLVEEIARVYGYDNFSEKHLIILGANTKKKRKY